MKKYVVCLIAVGTMLSQATVALASGPAPRSANESETIKSYDRALFYLANGVQTQARFEADKCIRGVSNDGSIPPPGTYGVFTISGFINIPGRAIAFSDNHLVVTPDGTVRTELIVYHLSVDGKAGVDIHFLSPTTFANLLPVRHYDCTLGEGVQLLTAAW